MTRLPYPGADENTWGEILNEFLLVSHDSDGTLRNNSVSSSNINAPAPSIGQVLSYDGSGLKWSDTTTAPEASSSVTGVVRLSGDLGGTADSPTVPGLSTKENTVAAGTTGQYYRGDKSWQSLDKAAVGLSNVDNTSDVNKPISSATQAALNNKQAGDATLTALASYDTNGFLTQTATDIFTSRTITGTVNQVAVSNGDGVAGNPVLSLPQNIATDSSVQFSSLGIGGPVGSRPVRITSTAPEIEFVETDQAKTWHIGGNDSGFKISETGVNDRMYFSGGSGYVGFSTVAPTHSLTLPSAANGLAMYNTVDHFTDYERLRLSWNSNEATLATEKGGTGTARNVHIDGQGSHVVVGNPGGGAVKVYRDNTAGNLLNVTSTSLSASSASQDGLLIDPTIAQSGTAGYAALHINPTESSTGSGSKYLVQAQVGGAARFAVDNDGNLTLSGTVDGRDIAADGAMLDTKLSKLVSINAQTGTSYTLVLDDADKLITLTNASPISLNVPAEATEAFPVGTLIKIAQMGAGQVTIVAAGGVAVFSDPGLKIAAQYGAAELIKTAADTWLLVGRLAP